MSYILDALKRAEAQRERGQVPGLNAQPVPVAAATAAPRRWGLWLGLLCAVAAVAAGGLYWHSDSTQAAPVPAPAPVLAAAPVAVPAPAPLPSVKSVPQTPAPAPAAHTPPPAAAQPAPPTAAPVVKPVPPQRREPASAAAPLPPLGDLPEDIRRTVPKLVVNGSVYSTNPAQRILIVNGQVLNEGATLAPDLVLETIGAKSAVLNLRGTRFRLDY